MAWGKRTAPPDAKGGVPDVMRICDECTALTGLVLSDPPVNGPKAICDGCGKFCNYLLWEVASDQWFNLEVKLAMKEGATK